MASDMNCVYCNPTSEKVIWSDNNCRVILIEDAPFAGLCRIVWNRHVKELTDLSPTDASTIFKVLCVVERGLRKMLSPDKMNLATLGTQVPHLHWHVIPRYEDDSHYPDPMWAAPKRQGVIRKLPADFIVDLQKYLADELK